MKGCVGVDLLQEVDCVVVVTVWLNVIDVIVCIDQAVLALFVDFRWLVKIYWRMDLLEEQNVGVFCLPPQLPVH